MARTKFVAGNWKMVTDRDRARELATAVASRCEGTSVQVAVCPPFPWLMAVKECLIGNQVKLGGQDCHFEQEGAFTGEVSASMLKSAGCDLVILGHSERRHGMGETDELINKKTVAALGQGLQVIFCLGELLEEREANQTEAVLDRQLTNGLAGLSPEQMENVVIAYEPVWAIGTGKVATTEQAQEAHAFIRGKISTFFGENVANTIQILYGGSVKPDNAGALMQQADVDGALVGGASLKADSFVAIIEAAQ